MKRSQGQMGAFSKPEGKREIFAEQKKPALEDHFGVHK
jgi:hypothetical protein